MERDRKKLTDDIGTPHPHILLTMHIHFEGCCLLPEDRKKSSPFVTANEFDHQVSAGIDYRAVTWIPEGIHSWNAAQLLIVSEQK